MTQEEFESTFINKVICGDCLDATKGWPANCVDSIVTDPPYGLEFMGKEWDSFKVGRSERYSSGGEVNLENITSRSGKGGAGPKYVNRPAKRCAKCGKQAWSGSPCKCDQPEWVIDNSPLYAFENFMFVVFSEALRIVKPGAHLLAFGGTRTFHRLACAIEDAGWEIRDCLGWLYGSGFPKSHNLKDKHTGWGTALKPAWEPVILARKPIEGTVAQNVQKYGTGAMNIDACRVGDDGWVPPSESSEHINLSRWPANIILDDSEEVRGLFPATGKNGSAARFFYSAKASRSERGEDNNHPTVKPLALMRYLCRVITPPGGIVLDMFCGSGTTCIAAQELGFCFIGLDSNADYCEIARRRLDAARAGQKSLFP